MSPFYINYGFEPSNLTRTIEVLADNLAIALIAVELYELHKNLRLELMFCYQ